MSNEVKEIHIKNRTCYFLDDIINMKNLDPNKIKIDKKSYKDIFIYCIGYLTLKNLSYIKINSVNPLYVKIFWLLCSVFIIQVYHFINKYNCIINPLYLIINKINGKVKERIGNKYLTLVRTEILLQ